MPAIANSKASRISENAAMMRFSRWPVLLVAVLASLISAGAVWFCSRQGWTLYYGDAEAHLNIARRVIDSRTAGYEQLGTAWLPMLHLLTLPLVRYDALWRTGFAGAIPPAIFFAAGVTFLFAAVRRMFDSTMAGALGAALYALNPNALYLASIPMTEAVFFGSLAALLYFTVRFRDTQSLWSVAGAGVAVFIGSLTRYDGWFLIPFATLYFLFTARRRRFTAAFIFGALASAGPVLWLAYNAWVFDNVWEFYSGPASAKAIQHGLPYPGHGDWRVASSYFGWAVRACAGAPLFFIGAAGVLAALWKRAFWPLLLLSLPGAFYLWNIHSADSPIHLPYLPPHGYYNTRYGLALLPLLAWCAAAIVAFLAGNRSVTVAARKWFACLAALVILAAASAPWLLTPRPEAWITWKESEHNSVARRAWTRKAADFFLVRYHPGEGVFTSFGDYTGVLREAGIPLRDTLTGDNGLAWQAAVLRPDLCLWEKWGLVQGGDPVQTAINRSRRRGPNYELARQIIVKGAPVIEIYERSTAPSNLYYPSHDDSIPQSARSEE
jgi:dolichyl-phosphate-mannose-protein mannosyltransferase